MSTTVYAARSHRPSPNPTKRVTMVTPAPNTLVAGCFDSPEYRDGFVASLPTTTAPRDLSVDHVATAYFLGQPRWLALVSMNVAGRERLECIVNDADFATGTSLGAWHVFDRNDDEIVFGDDMGFMEYRFSFRLTGDGRVEASTAVSYRWGRFGAMYFALVKPFHRRFVKMSLRNALDALLDPQRGA